MAYPITSLRHKNKVKGKVIFTPDFIATELFEVMADSLDRLILAKLAHNIKPIILDTCVGMGALLKPFKKKYGDTIETVGVDVMDYPDRQHCDVFLQKNWLDVRRTEIDFDRVAFCCQFPPFSDFRGLSELEGEWIKGPSRPADKRNSFIPDLFLSRLEFLKPGLPGYVVTPMGFRLNQRGVSRRRLKYADSLTAIITGIVSLPMDVFEDTQFHCEVLYFNTPGMPPHTWGGDGEKNPRIFER